MALDKDLLAKVKAGFKKQAFVPAGGQEGQEGAPAGGGQVDPATGMPVDPASGMPVDPNTGMPVDPSTGMPVDPNAMAAGGMPPPMDPSAMGGMPPAGGEELSPEGEPYIKLTFSQLLAAFDKISKLAQKLNGGGQAVAQNNNGTGSPDMSNDIKDIKALLMAGRA